jgi:hypothetical protein
MNQRLKFFGRNATAKYAGMKFLNTAEEIETAMD